MKQDAIAIITARGGSKRIPRKNVRPFCGRPILAYSIEAALGSGLFDEVIIGVGYNEQKSGWMPVDERLAAISRLYADEPRVKVVSYTGLTADFAKENGVTAIVRGVRTMADYDYEMQMADVNRQLTGIETVFLPASPQLASLSSSLLRELSHFGHDISAFLPKY